MHKKFRLKIIYNRGGCIGSGHCALADPYDFQIGEDFKAVMKEGQLVPGTKDTYFKIIETTEPHLSVNAAKTCTPRVIAVIDMDTGKRIDLTGYGKVEGSEEKKKEKEMDVEKRIAKEI